jgi:hypothetical protein
MPHAINQIDYMHENTHQQQYLNPQKNNFLL